MKVYENKIIPESIKKVLVETACDMCKKKIENGNYNVDEVEISHNHGTAFPEGGFTEEDSIDLCGECFQEKLIPWLKSQGCEIQTKDTGY